MTIEKSDYEKLGVFYLGQTFDAERQEVTDAPLLYDSRDLVTHAVCVGMTGSSKSGCASVCSKKPPSTVFLRS
jgi:hypothetical protein